MADDWNTISADRERVFTREVEVLRKRYLAHRETLGRLTSDAPSEYLAKEYARLQNEIDSAVAKLDELDRGAAAQRSAAAQRPSTVPPITAPIAAPPAAAMEPGRERSAWHDVPMNAAPVPEAPRTLAGLRAALVILIGVAVLGVVGYLLWHFLAGQPRADSATETAAVTPVITETEAPLVPPPAAEPLQIAPGDFNYGTIRKGTRATHQFTVTNATDTPLALTLSRSTCKCLWFKHPQTVPPHGTASLTITVDGGRAQRGAIDERVQVSSKDNPLAAVSVHVAAQVE